MPLLQVWARKAVGQRLVLGHTRRVETKAILYPNWLNNEIGPPSREGRLEGRLRVLLVGLKIQNVRNEQIAVVHQSSPTPHLLFATFSENKVDSSRLLKAGGGLVVQRSAFARRFFFGLQGL
jgi:hypothetical protein